VTVFAPLPERRFANGQVGRGGLMDGVMWAPLEQFVPYANATPHDVTIISRDLNLLQYQFLSPLTVFWCHDLALKRIRQPIAQSLWKLAAIYTLSAWQKSQYLQVYGVPESTVVQTRNGIHLDAFLPLRGLPRDPCKLVYGSRPERGLDAALHIMDRLARAGSPLRLEVSQYDHDGLAPQMQGFYQHLYQRAAALPNVVIKGALTQAQWREQLATARAWIYPGCPGDFREISCIAAMEAQAAGTPSVAIGKGAVPETLNGAGLIVGDESTDPLSAAHLDAFTAALVGLTSNDLQWQMLHKRALENAPGLDWAGVAEQWEADWLARFDRSTADAYRMRRHFERHGDHEAVRELGL
jgi:glycosyltransferase involved in cell wall biosynthesis